MRLGQPATAFWATSLPEIWAVFIAFRPPDQAAEAEAEAKAKLEWADWIDRKYGPGA